MVTRRLAATGQIVRGKSSWEVVSPRASALTREGGSPCKSLAALERRREARRAFGHRVRVLRESLAVSIEELAARAVLDPAVLDGIEQGVLDPDLYLIVAICRGLDVAPTTLLGLLVYGSADGLTPRQQQILVMLNGGQSYGEIAATLHISVSTVRTHARRIRQQLGVRTSRELSQCIPVDN